ncbi:unnamed protein product [Polarella glacialis]|uniref:Striatin N-terminal domain-containing protein n=1 Tax=Polarella glacialis TaxID=89957 RepID=A0A813G1L2_POLGL|nr:unnamed protein product [Polarella glacialis]
MTASPAMIPDPMSASPLLCRGQETLASIGWAIDKPFDSCEGSTVDSDLGQLEPLLRHLQTELRITNCERAEFELDRAELDSRIGEVESRLCSQQLTNQTLLRRVQMLEQALRLERLQSESLLCEAAGKRDSSLQKGPSAAGAEGGVLSLPNALPGQPSLEDRLRARKTSISARDILRSHLRAEMDRVDDAFDAFGRSQNSAAIPAATAVASRLDPPATTSDPLGEL